ncbi:MAG: DUF1553 domain-containing protein [Saprospiraceae bacterium]|nr:DUF1553 domain-containing protein [Saprospiraceae bacterium]
MVCCIAAIIFGCGGSEVLPDALSHLSEDLPDEVSFNFHIRPILSDRCYTCHGPDENKREGDLRLDSYQAATQPTVEGSKAIVPHRWKKSALAHRILSTHPDEVMPPPSSKLTLSDREKALLLKWIDQGAAYEQHWAFVPPTRNTEDAQSIDFFIDQALSTQEIVPNPMADKETLIRRARFGLTGLPPTIEEIDDFLLDASPAAFDNVIDRLLSSPAYGERMAADWMDIARYADSDGYLDDKHRDFSPWRDWVIQAFNQNMPYDEFVTWQLAGDLLPDPSQEQVLATAFNRLHRKNSEAGIVFEEYRVEYVADRLHTFGKAFLGMTIECARCHDHKFDPISQKEYYSLFAFFNQTAEMGTAVYGPDQTPGPSLMLSDSAQDALMAFINQELTTTEAKIAEQEKAFQEISPSHLTASAVASSYKSKLQAHQSFDKAVVQNKDQKLLPDEVTGAPPAKFNGGTLKAGGIQGQGYYIEDYGSVSMGKDVGWFDRFNPFSVSLWVYPAAHYEDAGLFTHCEDMRLGYRGYGLHLQDNRPRFIMAHSWPSNSIEILGNQTLPQNAWSHLTLTYDGSSRANGVKLYLNGSPIDVEVVVDNLYKGITYTPNIHTYGFHGFRYGYRDKIKNMHGGALDEIKIFDDVLTHAEIQYGHNGSIDLHNSALVKAHSWQNDFEPHQALKDALLAHRQDLNELQNKIPEIMVMGDGVPRATYVLNRGLYSEPTEEVSASTPAVLSPAFDTFSPTRLGLSQWLFHEDNPLAARVIANRIWQQHFGEGLVKTPEDFGLQGQLPSHPALLDFLANYLRAHDWDLKALHRLILQSNAYQRSSHQNGLDTQDPTNRWISRGPSYPLSAEMLRDNALALSGLLVNSVGGASVYPYQPEGLWDEISNKVWRYPYLQKPGDGLYRRSLYTIWKRTSPPPSMLIFDAPDRSFCTVKRQRTNTPLQALALLNDVQYLEAARHLALASLKKHDTVTEQLHYMARSVWGRNAKPTELEALMGYHADEVEAIITDPESALAYLSMGSVAPMATEVNAHNMALAKVAQNLFNTYEGQITK